MGRQSRFSVDVKMRIVGSVLSGAMTVPRAAEFYGVSTGSVYKWMGQLLEFGKSGLESAAAKQPSGEESASIQEVGEIKEAVRKIVKWAEAA